MSADTAQGVRPPAPIPGGRPDSTVVAGAIRQAAQSTGASFEHLLATAKVESNLNPNLTARSSSATGLFQFIEQTWLGVIKSAGRAFGYGRYADAVSQTRSGQYVVQDPSLREEVMRLRNDPVANAAMGGVLTQQNAAVLTRKVGRTPTDGELYIAHFFGPSAAAKVIGMATTNPNANAAELFPSAARANPSIFYDRQGHPRSVAGVYGELVRRYQVARASPALGIGPDFAGSAAATTRSRAAARDTAGTTAAFAFAAAAAVPGPSAVEPVAPLALAPAVRTASRSEPGNVFYSLFETEGRRAPVSAAVTELWGGGRSRAAAAGPLSGSRSDRSD